MNKPVIQRTELVGASLQLGGAPIDLSCYATTGLRILGVGQSGSGKTNAGLLIAEGLAAQGWQCILVDPEGEIESMYGEAVRDASHLRALLDKRTAKTIVVSARDAEEFVPYGQAILEASNQHRKPTFVMLDEGQLFSAPRRRKSAMGDAADLLNDFAERGRKRALDIFITAHRYTGSLHRSLFASQNLALIGRHEDPTAWSGLAPMFRGSKITFSDLAALAPGEFFCFSRQGIDKVVMPMAKELAKVAMHAVQAKPTLPSTFSQWDRAMRELPTDRLRSLDGPVVDLLCGVAGIPMQQRISGVRALRDEMEARA